MRTIITIETDNRVSLDKILDSFRMTKGVKKIEASLPKQIPGFAYTHEERVQELREAMSEDPSLEMTHEEFMKETATW